MTEGDKIGLAAFAGLIGGDGSGDAARGDPRLFWLSLGVGVTPPIAVRRFVLGDAGVGTAAHGLIRLTDPMAEAAGADAIPVVIDDGFEIAIIAARLAGELVHRVKPAFGERAPAFLADRGAERRLDTVLGGGFHLLNPVRRLRFEN